MEVTQGLPDVSASYAARQRRCVSSRGALEWARADNRPVDDGRLAHKEKLLRGAAFVRKTYAQSNPEWEHEHCELCGREIVEKGSQWDTAEAAHEGYSTPGPPGDPTDDHYWVCPSCFEDLRERLGWTLRGAPGDGYS